MEIHNTFAYDLETEDFATRASIAVKTQQVFGTDRLSLTETVGRRLSMINIKDYVNEIKIKEYEQDKISEETEEDTKSESNTKLDTSQSDLKDEQSNESKQNETEDEKVPEVLKEISINKDKATWFQPVRRLSFCELSEKRFIVSLPEIDNAPKEKCIKLIQNGNLIEENIENVKYLLKQTESKETGDEFES